MARTIRTNFVYPPIPPIRGKRNNDWCAWYDGEEESHRYGWGETEQEAINELKENYPEEDE